MPNSAVEELRSFDAILLAPSAILTSRRESWSRASCSNLASRWTNTSICPVRLYPGVQSPLRDKGPEHIDYAVIRENTGDLYTGTAASR